MSPTRHVERSCCGRWHGCRLALTLPQAQAAATTLSRQLEAAHPQYNEKMVFNLMPLHERVVGDVRPALLALLGAVGFVLLIACANIANLLLARGSSRGRELAVRIALGAARGRIVRQLLTESVLLAAIGGVAGVLLGVWAIDGLLSLAPESMPRLNEVRLEPGVLAFASLVTLLTGVIFGLGPAIQSARAGVTQSLKEGARGSTGIGGRALRRVLIAVEVAMALILLTGGGLLLRSFVELQGMDLGFKPDNILVGFVNPPRTAYDTPAKRLAFYDQIFEKARALPGVQKAALTSILPLGGGDSDTSFMIEGRPAAQSQSETPVTWYREVSARLLRSDGHTARRRPRLRGTRGGAVGGRERDVREEVLPERTAHRQAPALLAGAAGLHHHRRRGGREDRRSAGARLTRGDLRPLLAADGDRHRGGPQVGGESRRARRAAATGGRVGGPQRPDLERRAARRHRP